MFEEERLAVTPMPPVLPADDEPDLYPPSRSSSTVLRVVNGYDSPPSHHQQLTSTTFTSDYTTSSVNTASTLTSGSSSAENEPASQVPKTIIEVNGKVDPVKSEPPPPKSPPPRRSDRRVSSSSSRDVLSVTELQDLRGLLAVANTADECRLLVDMFLAKHGALSPTSRPAPLTRPIPMLSTSATLPLEQSSNEELEKSLVAALLGGDEFEGEEEEEEVVTATTEVKPALREVDLPVPEPVSQDKLDAEPTPLPKAEADTKAPSIVGPDDAPCEEVQLEAAKLRQSLKGVDLL